MKLLLLHNRTAGDGDAPEAQLRSAFGAAGHTLAYHAHGDEPVPTALLREADVLVVAGGDGTVARAFRAHRTDITRFAIVPLGTANNIATALGIGGSAEAIAAGLGSARIQPFDIGLLHQGPQAAQFVEGVGAGPIAEAMQAADQAGLSGEEGQRHCLSLIPDLIARARPQPWQVQVDGAPLPDELLLLEVLNAPRVGPRLLPTPSALAGDGLLDVAFLRPMGREALMQALARPDAAGKPRPLPLEHRRGRRVTLRLHHTTLRIDDRFETLMAPRDITLSLPSPPIHILVPHGMTGD